MSIFKASFIDGQMMTNKVVYRELGTASDSFYSAICIRVNWLLYFVPLQVQHPRRGLDQFDMVITPLHDYHALSPAARQEVPKLILPWITPQHPPDKHVVCPLETCLFFELLNILYLLLFVVNHYAICY
jgi:hypothetical protein